jgi:hypothetical protein
VILTCMAAITLLLLSMGCIGGGWAPDTRDGSEGELIELLRKFHQNRCSTFQEESLISQVKSGSWFVFTLGRRSEMQIVGAYERTLRLGYSRLNKRMDQASKTAITSVLLNSLLKNYSLFLLRMET